MVFKGVSSPENPLAFYEEVLQYLQKDVPGKIVTFDLQLDYFNTSSSKLLFKIIRILSGQHSRFDAVCVNWHYEEDDLDMKEIGEDMEELTDVKFNYVVFED